MERSPSLPPEKSGSFSCREERKQPEPTRNLSMGALKTHAHLGRSGLDRQDRERPEKVVEEEEQKTDGEEKDGDIEDENRAAGEDFPPAPDLGSASEEIDRFLDAVSGLIDGQNRGEDAQVDLPGVPEVALWSLLALVDSEISRYDVGEDRHLPAPLSCQDQGEFSLLDAVDRVSRFTAALGAFPSEAGYRRAMDRAGSVLQRAMSFLEEEFRLLLEDGRGDACKWTAPSQGSAHEPAERSPRTPAQEPNSARSSSEDDVPPAYPPETVERLRRIAGSMLSAGYETECCQVWKEAVTFSFE